MNITDFLNYMRGYVLVSITGRQPERFINLIMLKNIYLWDLKRNGREITFKISRKGFFMLRDAAYKTGTKVKILKKRGLFCLSKKMKNRKPLVAGLLIAFLMLNILSSFVLKIEIKGNNLVDSKKIMAKLSEIGLKKFTLRSNIDEGRISLKLVSDFDMIAWAGVYEKGTRIIIDIKERVKAPEIIPMNVPCDLVAKKEGIIEKLTVENGEKGVALGQYVAKGQILISGTVPIRNSEEKRYVHSMGSAVAKTSYVKENEFKLYEYQKEYTGKNKKSLNVKAFGKDILKETSSPYFNSDKNTKRRVFGFFELNTVTYNEYTLHKKKLSKKAAEAGVKKEISQAFKKELSKDIIKNITYEISYIDNETGLIKATAECIEEIAEEKEIEIWKNGLSDVQAPKE